MGKALRFTYAPDDVGRACLALGGAPWASWSKILSKVLVEHECSPEIPFLQIGTWAGQQQSIQTLE